VTGALVAPLTLLFLLAQQRWIVILVYFFLYQATNAPGPVRVTLTRARAFLPGSVDSSGFLAQCRY